MIGVGWMLGWPQVAPNAPAAPQLNAAAIDGLAARIASVEAKSGKSAAATPDPAVLARLETLATSLASLRGELAAARAQSDKLAAEVNQVASAPRDSAAAPDLSAINERLVRDRTHQQDPERRDRAAERQAGRRHAAAPRRGGVPARPVGAAGRSLRRRAGGGEIAEPGPGCAEAAGAICRHRRAERGPSQPRAADAGAETVAARRSPAQLPAGIVDRLEAGASRLVRIERTDAIGNDRGAVVARVTAAALHDESDEARRELKTLAPHDRAAAQAWIDKADARDAALAASRQFAADAMTALAEPRR